MTDLNFKVDQLSVKAGGDVQPASSTRNPSRRKLPVDEHDPRKRPLSVGEHQRVQQIEKEFRPFRTAEQKLEEDIRQRVHTPPAHVLIDLVPRPAVGRVIKCRVLLVSVHEVPPFLSRFLVTNYSKTRDRLKTGDPEFYSRRRKKSPTPNQSGGIYAGSN